MKNLMKRFVHEEEGQDLIEYGLLIGIITIACIVSSVVDQFPGRPRLLQ